MTPINPPATPLLSESATARETRFSFIAYGDTRGPRDAVEPGPGHTQVVEAMLETIKQMQGGPDPVRFVINSGDAVSNGRLTAPWNNAYVPLINRLTAANVPFFPTVGNHDVTDATTNLDPRRRTGLCHFFAATAALIPAEGSPRRLDGYPTYAFAYGNSFFIALDSHFAGDSLQFAWVERQLASLDRTRYVNVVVYFHHPAFSSAEHGTLRVEPYVALLRARYFPLFEKYHVRLVINGHEHEFEHWIERYEDASGPHRLDEIVSGGGGAPPYPYKREPDVADFLNDGAARHVTLEHRAKPQVDSLANAYHFVLVHVNGNDCASK